MGILKKTVFSQNLDKYNAFISDTDTNSRYFRVTQIPDVFTGGKNGFLIQGSTELAKDSYLMIEIKDAAGNTIYYEPAYGNPDYYEGTSKPVAVYVYNDTAFGPCTITILGELTEYEIDGVKYPIPDNWIGVPNVKWQRRVNVNPNLKNTTPIRFYKRPVATVTENLLPVYTRTASNVSTYGYLRGTAVTPTDGVLAPFQGDVVYLIESIDSASFSKTSLSGIPLKTTMNISEITGYTLSAVDRGSIKGTIENPIIPFTPSTLETKIDSFVDQYRAYVTLPYTQLKNNKQYYRDIFIARWDTSYETGLQFVESGFSSSYAEIKIENLDTFTGDVARCKVFIKSKNSVRGYQLLEDIVVESNELLQVPFLENDINVRTGIFTKNSILQNYWSLYPIPNIPAAYYTTGSFPNLHSVNISPDSDYPYLNSFLARFVYNTDLPFKKEKEYQLSFTPTLLDVDVDGFGGNIDSTNDGILYVYATSSAGPNNDGTYTFNDSKSNENYGKKLLQLRIPKPLTVSGSKVPRQSINFLADNDGLGSISFNVLRGTWNLYDISLKSYQEDAFTPTDISFYTKPTQLVPSESFDFKFEFFDTNFNYVPVNVTNQTQFLGGSDIVPGLFVSTSANVFVVNDDGLTATPATISIDYTTNAILTTIINTYSASNGAAVYDNRSISIGGPTIINASHVRSGFPFPGVLLPTDDPINFPNRKLLTFANFSSSILPTAGSETYTFPDGKKRVGYIKYKAQTAGAIGLDGQLLPNQLTVLFQISASYDAVTTTTTTTTTSTTTTSTTTTSTSTTSTTSTTLPQAARPRFYNSWLVQDAGRSNAVVANPIITRIDYRVSSVFPPDPWIVVSNLQYQGSSVSYPISSSGFLIWNGLPSLRSLVTGSFALNTYDIRLWVKWTGSGYAQPWDSTVSGDEVYPHPDYGLDPIDNAYYQLGGRTTKIYANSVSKSSIDNPLPTIDWNRTWTYTFLSVPMTASNLSATNETKFTVTDVAQNFGIIPPTCCFMPGTLVLMSDGSSKPIEFVEVGDIVISYNFELANNVENKVINVYGPEHITMYKIIFENGNFVEISSDHPLYTKEKGWASINSTYGKNVYGDYVNDIQLGYNVLSSNGHYVKIIDIETMHIPSTKTYTISTENENNSNYYANGVLAHNQPGQTTITCGQ